MAKRQEPVRVTVIGDNFMLPEKFIASLNRLDGIPFTIRQHCQNWPDEDMTHGYDPADRGGTLDQAGLADDQPGLPDDHAGLEDAYAGLEDAYADLADLKEYFGTPDDVIPLIRDAEIFIGHLAPISQSVINAAPNLKLIGISRPRRPRQHRHGCGPHPGDTGGEHAWSKRRCRRRIHHRHDPQPDPPDHHRPHRPC